MTDLQVQGAALVAMVLSLPLISWGSTAEIQAVTIIGAVLLSASLLSLTVLHFVETREEK